MTNTAAAETTASEYIREAIPDTLGASAREKIAHVLREMNGKWLGEIEKSTHMAGVALDALSGLIAESTVECHACKSKIRRDRSFKLQYSSGRPVMYPETRCCTECAERWIGGGFLYQCDQVPCETARFADHGAETVKIAGERVRSSWRG